MENYEQILKDLGVEIPEDKKADLKKKMEENYSTKEDYDKAVEKRDEYKTSLEQVQEKEGFKNLTAKDLQEKRERRFEDHKGRDYELGLGIGNNREYRKTARSNRLINRIMSKR